MDAAGFEMTESLRVTWMTAQRADSDLLTIIKECHRERVNNENLAGTESRATAYWRGTLPRMAEYGGLLWSRGEMLQLT